MNSIPFFLTPAGGKRLIARALASSPVVQEALDRRTVVIIAGTTNAYLAEELLGQIGCRFDPKGFYRGILKPPAALLPAPSRGEDVVIVKGQWLAGKTIYDVADSLVAGDLIFKGANAIHLGSGTAGVIIGNPTTGTMASISAAVVGRRVRLIHPVGVEKRVEEPIPSLAARCNRPGAAGFRLYPTAGTVYTELDALCDLCGVQASLMAGGGVAGYEGGCYFLCEGSREALEKCRAILKEVGQEPPFLQWMTHDV